MIRPSLLLSLKNEYEIEPEELTPTSTWFSYGSNLLRSNFEQKMKRNGSNLSLLCALKATLPDFERKLDNLSSTRGLAYRIKHSPGSSVSGILHDIPVADLPVILRFEGVLDEYYKLKCIKGERRYDIERAKAKLEKNGLEVNCLILVAFSPVLDDSKRSAIINQRRSDIIEYIQESIDGAKEFGINQSAFEKDLTEIQRR